jgi:heme exporter protein C
MTSIIRPGASFVLRRWQWLGAFALAALAATQALGFLVSPPDRDMGHLQKIMYVHVPAAWMTFIAFFVVFACSIGLLWRRREEYDLLAAAAAEVGLVFNGLTLVLGMIWGKPTWGVWWTWDARLTSTLVLFLIFLGYVALRALVDDPERRAVWSAVVGIVGAINVPIVYMSVRWWRTLHQVQSSPSTVDPAYVMGLRSSAIAFLLLLVFFIHLRYRAAVLEQRADRAREAAALGTAGESP